MFALLVPSADYDVNGNSAQDDEDESLGLASLFADLPSNMPNRSYHNNKSRKSLRRRASAKRPSTAPSSNNISVTVAPDDIPENILRIIDLEDGVDGKEIRNLPAPMAQKKSVR